MDLSTISQHPILEIKWDIHYSLLWNFTNAFKYFIILKRLTSKTKNKSLSGFIGRCNKNSHLVVSQMPKSKHYKKLKKDKTYLVRIQTGDRIEMSNLFASLIYKICWIEDKKLFKKERIFYSKRKARALKSERVQVKSKITVKNLEKDSSKIILTWWMVLPFK